jgi:uncharacterized Zn-binding protein involved in type VI secretion
MAVLNISRKGDFFSTGHGCDTISTIRDGNDVLNSARNVYAEGKLVTFLGASRVTHEIPNPSPPRLCITHSSTIKSGSRTVFVNGIAVARETDSVDAGQMLFRTGTVHAG